VSSRPAHAGSPATRSSTRHTFQRTRQHAPFARAARGSEAAAKGPTVPLGPRIVSRYAARLGGGDLFCPNCGTQNADTAQTCSKCDFHLQGLGAPKFKGTMLMMNQPPAPQATPAGPAVPGRPRPPTPGETPAAPATGAVARPAVAAVNKLKGTMVGVAPMMGLPAEPMPPAQKDALAGNIPASPMGETQPSAYQPPIAERGGVNPLGGTVVAGPGGVDAPPMGGASAGRYAGPQGLARTMVGGSAYAAPGAPAASVASDVPAPTSPTSTGSSTLGSAASGGIVPSEPLGFGPPSGPTFGAPSYRQAGRVEAGGFMSGDPTRRNAFLTGLLPMSVMFGLGGLFAILALALKSLPLVIVSSLAFFGCATWYLVLHRRRR
jgi:hypothetical protein